MASHFRPGFFETIARPPNKPIIIPKIEEYDKSKRKTIISDINIDGFDDWYQYIPKIVNYEE